MLFFYPKFHENKTMKTKLTMHLELVIHMFIQKFSFRKTFLLTTMDESMVKYTIQLP